MHRAIVSSIATGIALAGLGAPAQAGLLSATGAVIAIMSGELFLGEAEGHISGAGTVSIKSQTTPALSCFGRFTSSKPGGTGQLDCSDGSKATFSFKRLTAFRGHGDGYAGSGTMSFVYGLTAEEAEPYLKLPKGKKLVRSGTALALVDL